MAVPFERWNGAGDLLDIIDNRKGQYASFMADTDAKRRLVAVTGANGIMEVLPVEGSTGAAYTVRMHTGLGQCGPVPVCGNGSRCAAAWACEYGLVPTDSWANFSFVTCDGVHSASVSDVTGSHDISRASGRLYDVTISMADIPEVVAAGTDGWFTNTGEAHYVHFLPPGTNLSDLDVDAEGRHLAHLQHHLGDDLIALVSFVTVGPDGVRARCYDTAVGEEILACGTASMAIAVSTAAHAGMADGAHQVAVQWAGGTKVSVGYTRTGNSFTNNSLRSVVFREVKGSWGPDQKGNE